MNKNKESEEFLRERVEIMGASIDALEKRNDLIIKDIELLEYKYAQLINRLVAALTGGIPE